MDPLFPLFLISIIETETRELSCFHFVPRVFTQNGEFLNRFLSLNLLPRNENSSTFENLVKREPAKYFSKNKKHDFLPPSFLKIGDGNDTRQVCYAHVYSTCNFEICCFTENCRRGWKEQ